MSISNVLNNVKTGFANACAAVGNKAKAGAAFIVDQHKNDKVVAAAGKSIEAGKQSALGYLQSVRDANLDGATFFSDNIKKIVVPYGASKVRTGATKVVNAFVSYHNAVNQTGEVVSQRAAKFVYNCIATPLKPMASFLAGTTGEIIVDTAATAIACVVRAVGLIATFALSILPELAILGAAAFGVMHLVIAAGASAAVLGGLKVAGYVLAALAAAGYIVRNEMLHAKHSKEIAALPGLIAAHSDAKQKAMLKKAGLALLGTAAVAAFAYYCGPTVVAKTGEGLSAAYKFAAPIASSAATSVYNTVTAIPGAISSAARTLANTTPQEKFDGSVAAVSSFLSGIANLATSVGGKIASLFAKLPPKCLASEDPLLGLANNIGVASYVQGVATCPDSATATSYAQGLATSAAKIAKAIAA